MFTRTLKPDMKINEVDGNPRPSTACVVCGVSIFHFGYEPMNMGCQCHEKICKRCVTVGNVVNCPLCRKYRRKPLADNKWRRKRCNENQMITEACLGCGDVLSITEISTHEYTCPKYRDILDCVRDEEFTVCRNRADIRESEIQELNERVDIQNRELEDLEENCDGLKVVILSYETEKRIYDCEQQEIIGALNKLSRPLKLLHQRVLNMQSTIEDLKGRIKANKENHRNLCNKRRRLGIEPSQIWSDVQHMVEDDSVSGDDTVEVIVQNVNSVVVENNTSNDDNTFQTP